MRLDEEVSLRDDVLPQLLHGIEVLCAILLHQVHLAKATSADDFDEFEVLESDLFCRGEQVFTVVVLDIRLHHLRHGHILVDCRGHDLLVGIASDTLLRRNYRTT